MSDLQRQDNAADLSAAHADDEPAPRDADDTQGEPGGPDTPSAKKSDSAGQAGHAGAGSPLAESAFPKAAPTPAPREPAKAKPKKRPLLMKQKMMNRMLYAMAPLIPASVYFFGWRVLAVLAVVHVVGFGTEYLTARSRGKPVSMACFVTIWLYGLSLPPTVPYLVAAVGMVVAILFGKEVFGGFGRNFANPAIVGRAFVYICFPIALTAQFVPAFKGFPGGLAHWSWEAQDQFPAYIREDLAKAPDGEHKTLTDAVSMATPLVVNRDYGWDKVEPALVDMATGAIGGTYTVGERTEFLAAGSMGEGCAILIVLAGIYLLVTKTANYRLMLGGVLGLVLGTVLFRHVLGFDGQGQVPPLHFSLLAGTTLYATVFMVTEPVSAPSKKPAMWAYAVLIGFLMVLLRWKGIFAAAATFSILLGNLLAPLLDLGARAWADRKKARAAKGDAS